MAAQYITTASFPKGQQVCMHLNSDGRVACVRQRCLFMTNTVHCGSSLNNCLHTSLLSIYTQ